jgi:hypothetical protein
MSNYYHRDKEGNWFIKDRDKLYPVELSGSMEIAYILGKTAAIDELKERWHEYTLQTGNP